MYKTGDVLVYIGGESKCFTFHKHYKIVNNYLNLSGIVVVVLDDEKDQHDLNGDYLNDNFDDLKVIRKLKLDNLKFFC